MTTTQTPKRSRTKDNPCQCLVFLGDDYIDDEMRELGYTPETNRYYDRGCGEMCVREFAQGHDAKYKSILIDAHRAGVEMGIYEGGLLIHTDAMTLAEQRGWEHFLTAKPKRVRRPKGQTSVADAEHATEAALNAALGLAEDAEPFGHLPVAELMPVGTVVEFSYRNGTLTGTVKAIEGDRRIVDATTKGGRFLSKSFDTIDLTEVKEGDQA